MLPIIPEPTGAEPAIEALLDQSFGPDRHLKTVYKLREGVDPIASLSFCVYEGARLLGSIRYWPIEIGGQWQGVMLGPVAVDPDRRGEGIGKALIRHSLWAATRLGHKICMLVGDRPYYEPFGFHSALDHGLELPGWVDPDRFLVMELAPGALDGVSGMIGAPSKAPAQAARGKATRAA